jgi:hypothetical protein
MKTLRHLSSSRNGVMRLKTESVRSSVTTLRLIWTGEDGPHWPAEELKPSFITNELTYFIEQWYATSK